MMHLTANDNCKRRSRSKGRVYTLRVSRRQRTVFETWLETCLVPQLQPNQVVILDNATFHHGGRVAEMIEAAGCQLLYLPPYSPDFNRIEKGWAWLKSRIRKRLGKAPSLRDAMEAVLKDAAA